MFKKQNALQCFFCHSQVPQPRDSYNWRCDSCGCWNRFDKSSGEILSYEPAMHEESLNTRSFNRRGSPSKTTLPTMYPSQTPFCRSCQTNHMMVMNLLSDYLPPPESPDYNSRMASLPAYRASLEARYPAACDSCLPQIQDKIKEKDSMARTTALSGWLQNSKSRDLQRHRSATLEPPDHKGKQKTASSIFPSVEMFAWRLRGVLWLGTWLISLWGNLNGALGWDSPSLFVPIRPILPLLCLMSIFWTAWDPTYSSLRRAQRQGRDVRQRGKECYIRLQMFSWAFRFITSSLLAWQWFHPQFQLPFPRMYFSLTLFIEAHCLVVSCSVLRLTRPPAIKLIDSSSHKHLDGSVLSSVEPRSRSSTPIQHTNGPAEVDFLAGLTLSSKPVMSNPVFGMPSLSGNSPSKTAHANDVQDEDAMDWSPTSPDSMEQPNAKDGQRNAGSYIRPQTFFPREQPTGLEALFERAARLGDDDDDIPMPGPESPSLSRSGVRPLHQLLVILGALLALILSFGLGIWIRGRPAAQEIYLSTPSVTLIPPSMASSHEESESLYEHLD